MDTIFIVKVHGFDGNFISLSYHRTKEGAEKAARKAANNEYANFDGTEGFNYVDEVKLKD